MLFKCCEYCRLNRNNVIIYKIYKSLHCLMAGEVKKNIIYIIKHESLNMQYR